tara:strand:+ start:66 stop:176 length:111 start_codon:yes stop_codon:yes gene_type:complete
MGSNGANLALFLNAFIDATGLVLSDPITITTGHHPA